jgi:nucleotide-binding universal stress UspA family protein
MTLLPATSLAAVWQPVWLQACVSGVRVVPRRVHSNIRWRFGWIEQAQCDLIAMTTHGHRFVEDLLYGSTITAVRHKSQISILLVRATSV